MATNRLPFWSACLGNFFEHYDTALFGFLSPFLAPLIFPHHEFLMALILTYAMIPLGMLARPLGAVFFGYIGDRRGRQNALFLSLLGMAFISMFVAVSPTYAQAGYLASIIFCLSRLMQNFLASGEIIGGAIFLLENAEKKRHDLLSSLYSASTIGGILLASGGVALFSYFHKIEWGWRVLYLFGSITGVFGCMIRRQTGFQMPAISPTFKESFSTLRSVLWKEKKALFLISIVSGFGYANYSMSLVLMNGFIPLITAYSKEQMVSLNSVLLILDFVTLPLFGWLATRFSREKMMLGASLCIALTAIPLFLLLQKATLLLIFGIRLIFVLYGVAFFAPFHAWAQERVSAKHRYLILSFGYALGSQLFGGPTTAFSLLLFKQTGFIATVSFYWILLATSTFVILARSKRIKVIA